MTVAPVTIVTRELQDHFFVFFCAAYPGSLSSSTWRSAFVASLQRRATLVEEQRLGGRLLRRSAAQAVGAHADDDGTDGAAEPEVEISAQALADNVVVEQMSRVVEVDPPHLPPSPPAAAAGRRRATCTCHRSRVCRHRLRVDFWSCPTARPVREERAWHTIARTAHAGTSE